MTSPFPSFLNDAVGHYRRLTARAAGRDNLHSLIHQVRRGHIRQLFPSDLNWSLEFNGSPVANFIDVVARDMAEGLAPLPALACVSGRMKSQADEKRAEVKNRIGEYYWRESKLAIQMLTAADQLVSYGFLPGFVEPKVDDKRPHISMIDPRGSYYELDRWGCTQVFYKKYLKSIDALCAMFPEYAALIRRDPNTGRDAAGDNMLDMVQMVDKTSVTLFLPERSGLRLGGYDHKMSRCPVKIIRRPGDDDDPRGQFDDVIYVQVARAMFATLALEAASLAVQAPIAVPEDMTEFPVGPHAILQSKDANQIHRVGIDLPTTVFAEAQSLDQELRVGTRYPDARSGNAAGASVVTGKGVEALLGTFDSQIKGGQIILKDGFEDLTSMCFEMDEAWWPHDSKTINGTISGTSYEFDYTPANDINGRHACTVTYGFAAGLQPEQASIWMLQLEGAGMLAKGTVQENLPFFIDQVQEQKKIHVERSREALEQGVFALVGASGQMAAQGQDPMPIINMAVEMIRGLEDGKPVEESIAQAYQDMVPAQQQQKQQELQDMAAAQGGDQGQGPDQSGGSAPDVGGGGFTPPGQQGMPAGGRPSLEAMVSGFRGNGTVPVMQNEIRRSVPIGTA